MNRQATELSQFWRVSSVGRFGACLVVGFWLIPSLLFTLGDVPRGVVLGAWLTTALVAVGAWRWAFVPFIGLTAEAVVIQNRVRRTAIPYSDLRDVRPGYYGLSISRRSGASVTAWAVQKSNVKRWQGVTTTRADVVAAAILARKKQAG